MKITMLIKNCNEIKFYTHTHTHTHTHTYNNLQ